MTQRRHLEPFWLSTGATPERLKGFFYSTFMARPEKNNCEYFPHFATMRNHRKIKAVRTKFGPVGFAIWVMLLEYLTDADGNEFHYSDLEIELLCGDFGVSVAEIRDVIEYGLQLELLFNKNGFIHSESLDETLAPVYAKRKKSKEESAKRKRLNGQFVTETTEPSGVSVAETPQSKVEYSKVKESKVNYSKSELTPSASDQEEQISLNSEKEETPQVSPTPPKLTKEERIALFAEKVVQVNGEKKVLEMTEEVKFLTYWTETEEGSKLFRAEIAKNRPFDTYRRLITWRENNKKSNFTQPNKQAPTYQRTAYDY